LWTLEAIDYTNVQRQVQIFTRTLNVNGTVSNVKGPVGISGIPDRRAFGGIQPVPAWFQTQYGVGPYAIGWGGYTSLLVQAGGASLGPTMYFIPDPAGYADNTEIPSNSFRIGMDCVSGTSGTDWYLGSATTHPSSFDRGIRVSPVTNYFDFNDPRQNPTTPPVAPPSPGNWLSPAPDGYGRWVWGDTHLGTGCWIDGPNKQGFLLIPSLGAGVVYYGGSTLNFSSRAYEFHIYDPAKIGEAVQGTRPVWDVKPRALWPETFAGLGNVWLDGTGGSAGMINGATYDAVGGRLYVMGTGINHTGLSRLYVYSVSA
jgi:hypothetical protein